MLFIFPFNMTKYDNIIFNLCISLKQHDLSVFISNSNKIK